jgi:predicted phosphodiesterase
LYANKDKADVLVVAGDLAVGHDRVWSALKQFGEAHERVVYVSGNHEYYRSNIQVFDDYISRFARNSNISFLNPGSVVIDGVAFIGANLWTNFRKDRIAKMACARNIADFSLINSFNTDYCDVLHTEHINYIRKAYSIFEGYKKVIVTHFLPAIECISEQYRDRFGQVDLLNYYFANDYGQEIADMQNTTWLFGHTHDNVNITIGDTRCIANPYGYNYNGKYKEMLIEI